MLNFVGSKRLLCGYHTEIEEGKTIQLGKKKSEGSINLWGGAKIFKNFFCSQMIYNYRRIRKAKKHLPIKFFCPPPRFV